MELAWENIQLSNCSGNSLTLMHLVFLIQTTQSVNQSINQSVDNYTALDQQSVTKRPTARNVLVSQDTRFVDAAVESKTTKQMKSTGGISGLFIRFALAAQISFIFSRVGGTQHTSTVSESRSCQSVVFVLISRPHPPTKRALIQLHELGGHERTDR